MPSRALVRPCALIAAGALISSSQARGPRHEFLPLYADPGHHLPAVALAGSVSKLGMSTPRSLLLRTGSGDVYFSDGAIRRAMVPGAPIPGLDGATWSGDFEVDLWPLDTGGSLMRASANGPGIPGQALFAGPVEAPSLLGDEPNLGCTPNGLRRRITPEGVEVGPLAGPFNLVLPAGFVPPGMSGPFTATSVQLNPRGEVTAVGWAEGPGGAAFRTCLVAGADGVRVVHASTSPLVVDRGAPPNYRLFAMTASAARLDGAVVLGVNSAFTGGVGLWLAPPSGPATAIALSGDRAPGAPRGAVFDTVRFLGANRTGAVLFQAVLRGPGLTDDYRKNAVYLWRNGESREILHARQPGGGSSFGPLLGVACLNDQDDVGVIYDGCAGLYSPRAGTSVFVDPGRMLPPESGAAGQALWAGWFLGSSTAERSSGGDDANLSHLSPDGWFFFGCATTHGPYYASVRIADAGCISDFNNDGFTDFFDYSDFVECFEGGECPEGRTGDSNHDDFADFFDYLDFVQAFEAGC